MKTMVKLVMLLAVLAICMPAQGEILIYSKIYRCWEAWEVFNGVPWAIDEWTQKGFLILDVDYKGEIVEIIDAYQVEYERDGRDKWYWGYSERMVVERVDVGDEVIWVLELLHLDIEPDEVWLLMVRGKSRDMNIGLGRDEQREVARVLNGYIMQLDFAGMGTEKMMCTETLRLHNRFTRLGNDPDECDGNFECAVVDIVIDWLEDRGYEGGG